MSHPSVATTNVCAVFCAKPSSSCWEFSLIEWKYNLGGAAWRVGSSPESIGCILWWPRVFVQKLHGSLSNEFRDFSLHQSHQLSSLEPSHYFGRKKKTKKKKHGLACCGSCLLKCSITIQIQAQTWGTVSKNFMTKLPKSIIIKTKI